MRRSLLPVLLFVLAAAGTLLLGARLHDAGKVSAGRSARERLAARAREGAANLAAAAERALRGPPSFGLSVPGSPPRPRPFPRLPAPPPGEGAFYLERGAVAESVEGDATRADGLYAAAAAPGLPAEARAHALFRRAALARRAGDAERAALHEEAFLALPVPGLPATLEGLLVRARRRTVDGRLAADLLVGIGSAEEGIALGLLREAGLADGAALARRRAEAATLRRIAEFEASGADLPAEGAAVREGFLLAWRREGLAPAFREIPLPDLPEGVRVLAPGGTAESADRIMVTEEAPAPLVGTVVVAALPLASLEAEARRGALLLGGALAALLCAGGAALVLSVRAARRETEAARARADFVTKVGHEIRTPLAVVRLYAETLAEGRVADPAEAREFAAVAAREAGRLTGMVDQVLDLTRVASAESALPRHPFDLAALAAEVAAVHRPLLERAGLRLEVRSDGPLPVLGDSAALRGALANLLENAARHAAAGGEVAVETARAGRMAVLRVLDRGPGLPAGMEAAVFERFVRGPGAAGSGAGLGLALVREAAEAHGGRARAEPREGGGAAFVLEIPAAEEGA